MPGDFRPAILEAMHDDSGAPGPARHWRTTLIASTLIVPGGQAALALVYLAYCTAGSHALVPSTAYGPNLEIARDLLTGLGVEVETYDPMAGAAIAAQLRPNTALAWCESPGSITMEIQDVPAIVRTAHARGVPVALDNTYAAGVLFDAFGHGVDVSVQALTTRRPPLASARHTGCWA